MFPRGKLLSLMGQENQTAFKCDLEFEEKNRIASLPKYESTKGSNFFERELALRGSQNILNITEILNKKFSEETRYLPKKFIQISDTKSIKGSDMTTNLRSDGKQAINTENKKEGKQRIYYDFSSEDKTSGSEYIFNSDELLGSTDEADKKLIKRRKKKKKKIFRTETKCKPNDDIFMNTGVATTSSESTIKTMIFDDVSTQCVSDTEPVTCFKSEETQVAFTSNVPKKKINIISNVQIKPATKVKRCVSSEFSTTITTPTETKFPSNNSPMVNISAAKKNTLGKRIRDKKHSCYYCHQMILHIARHLELKHEKEIDVARALSFPKMSTKRKELFAEITRAGNFHYNCEAISLKRGDLILVRRPTPNELQFNKYTDYGPCPNCLGFLLKKNLWHHLKTCFPKNSDDLQSDNAERSCRRIIAESNAILSNVFGSELSSEYIKTIVNTLRDDDIGNYCREDNLILKFGAMYFEKYGATQNELIRQNMRQLARLTMTVRETTSLNLSLVDLLTPLKFDVIIQGVKKLCQVQQNDSAKKPEFETPSLVLKLGHSLRKCANIERGVALKQENLKRNESLVSFCNLMDLEWQIRVSSNALSTLNRRKFNAGQLLPVTSDLIKFNNYIKQEIIEAKNSLIKSPSTEKWNRLAKLVLCRIILFNKRRAGEASKMTLEQYSGRALWKEGATEELKSTLTPYEVKLAERHIVVNIIGKRGRMVPVLLTPEAKTGLDILISHRSVATGIKSENPYIFATKSENLTHIRGPNTMRDILKEVADLEKPHLITSTKLRKYVSTVCQMFDLNETEYDWLARHLGHDIKVHREFYRLHEDVVELTKVSRILMAVDTGEANKFAGMPLKDIKLTELYDIDEESEEEEEGGEELKNEDTRKINYSEDEDLNQYVMPKLENKRATTKSTVAKVKCTKIAWDSKEKKAVLEYFRPQIKRGIVPGKAECEACQSQYKNLRTRKWTDIKFCVKNQITKVKNSLPKK